MRILVLSQWYPPEPAPIGHTMACELVKGEHQVLSITGFPNYPSGKIYPGYRQRLWQREEIDGVPVLRLPLYPDRSRSGVCRALNFFSFAASASLLGPILCGSADVMWVYHPALTVGLPLIEAAAFGLPILTVDIDYTGELIGDYNGVKFLDYQDAKVWAENIIKSYNKRMKYKRMKCLGQI